ncbi:MAG: hypothetical protein GXO92_01390 [FCB group bacterium]|nr:hypothetical protein [FCB group bacterium]
MKRLFLLGIYITCLQGQNSYADAFLNLGTSPRSIALGRAVVALPQHTGGYLVNPAATGFTPSPTLSGMFINQFGLADYVSMGVSIPKNKYYQWGVNTVLLYVDNIPERPDLRNVTDLAVRRDSIRALVRQGFRSFKDIEAAVTFNISKNITKTIDPGWQFAPFPVKIPFGMNVKILRKNLHAIQGIGLGIDIGTMIMVNLEQVSTFDWLGDLVAGVSLNNIAGTRIYWNTNKEDLIPMQLITGISYKQSFDRWPVKIAIFEQQNSLYPREIQFGLEGELFDKISIRGGLTGDYIQCGLGLVFQRKGKTVSLDYSFSNHDLGKAHRIGGWVGF